MSRRPKNLNDNPASTLFADVVLHEYSLTSWIGILNTTAFADYWLINHPVKNKIAGNSQAYAAGGNQVFLDGSAKWVKDYPQPLIPRAFPGENMNAIHHPPSMTWQIWW